MAECEPEGLAGVQAIRHPHHQDHLVSWPSLGPISPLNSLSIIRTTKRFRWLVRGTLLNAWLLAFWRLFPAAGLRLGARLGEFKQAACRPAGHQFDREHRLIHSAACSRQAVSRRTARTARQEPAASTLPAGQGVDHLPQAAVQRSARTPRHGRQMG